MNTDPRLKTADEWSRIKGIRVVDPDGWREKGIDWDARVSEALFDEMAMRSTQCPI